MELIGKTAAIVPAAGTGKRMGKDVPKQFLSIQGKPIFIYTLEVLDRCRMVDEVVLVMAPDHLERAREHIEEFGVRKVTQVIAGGRERQDSVMNGLQNLTQVSVVLVHDGVRPFATEKQVKAVIQMVRKHGAAIVAVPAKNTIKRVDNGRVEVTLNRDLLWQVQTPQGFRFDLLKQAYEQAYADKCYMTDDSALVERLGHTVHIVEGDYRNIKITSPEDLAVAEAYLALEAS